MYYQYFYYAYIKITNIFHNVCIQTKQNMDMIYKGREFYNKLMKLWLHDNDIKMYPTHNEGKSVVLKDLLQPHFLHIYTHI